MSGIYDADWNRCYLSKTGGGGCIMETVHGYLLPPGMEHSMIAREYNLQ
jgi:hypothetical protein